MKTIKVVVVTLCPIILAFLSNLPSNHDNGIVKFLIQYKLTISVVCAAVVFLYEIWNLVFPEDYIIRTWTTKFLRFIAKEKLGGGEFDTRISILRPQKGWQIIFKYFFYAYVHDFFLNFHRHTWKQVFFNTPIHLFSDYLTVYARYSYPKENTSVTHFRISGRNEGNGVAEKCFKEGNEIEVMTCNISRFYIPNCYDSLVKSRLSGHKHIKQYMKDTFFDDKHFHSLLSINKRANNIYAVAISNENEEIWGVLIIDNISDNPRSFKEELKDVIGDYAKIFCFTLSTIK